VDSIIGILNPFDAESLEKQLIDTDVPHRPDPSEIHVVYSIYGIVSEHTPEEWEVIREHKNRGWTMSRLFVDDEQQRMKDAGFKLSFRHLDEDAPQPKIPTPSVLPSAPPILPATPAPAEQPSDYAIPIPESEPQSGLGITDTIIGIFGGTRGDYVDQYFNFLYGVGDNMSLGIGWWLRSTFFDDQADYGGSSYYIGSWVGFIADLAIGGAFKSIGKVFGKELLEQGARNVPFNGGIRNALGSIKDDIYAAPAGSWLPPLEKYGLTLKEIPYYHANTGRLGRLLSKPKVIEIDSGMHELYKLGAIRHEFAHWMIRRATLSATDFTYKISNILNMTEEMVVHTWAVRSLPKGFAHAKNYFSPLHFGIELPVWLSGGVGIWYATRD
jgi:hypothetical protein